MTRRARLRGRCARPWTRQPNCCRATVFTPLARSSTVVTSSRCTTRTMIGCCCTGRASRHQPGSSWRRCSASTTATRSTRRSWIRTTARRMERSSNGRTPPSMACAHLSTPRCLRLLTSWWSNTPGSRWFRLLCRSTSSSSWRRSSKGWSRSVRSTFRPRTTNRTTRTCCRATTQHSSFSGSTSGLMWLRCC